MCVKRVTLPASAQRHLVAITHSSLRLSHRAGDRHLVDKGLSLPSGIVQREPSMPPPSQLEVVAFWITGIVITILSGGVAIYASHHHLWG
jgi:hypothetical protein